MEEYVFYIPNLESRFNEKKNLHQQIVNLAKGTPNPWSNIIHLKGGRTLFLRSISFGKMEFEFLIFDFETNYITFRRGSNSNGDTNRLIYNLLTSFNWDFQPRVMSYAMERKERQK